MQQHPIPQNITGFEFKLIGDMTIKQFGYLAGSAVLTYVFFVLPIHPFVKYPLVGFIPLLGIGLAFIPVEGRPLDRWIKNFIRALFTPSQYLFHKQQSTPEFLKSYAPPPKVTASKTDSLTNQGGSIGQTQMTGSTNGRQLHNKVSGAQFTQFLKSISSSPATNEEDKIRLLEINEAFSQPIATPTIPSPPPPSVSSTQVEEKLRPPQPIPASPIDAGPISQAKTTPTLSAPTSPVLSGFSVPYQSPPPGAYTATQATLAAPVSGDPLLDKKLEEERALEEENNKLKAQLEVLKKQLMQPSTPASQTHVINEPVPHVGQETLDIGQKLHEALSEKERLAGELSKLRNQAAAKNAPAAVTPTPIPVPKQSDKVRVIPAQLAASAGFAGFAQVPNVISGIVKDTKGEILPNIILEIKDQGHNPVRAFKTNKLGQFSGATPLANGKYLIELEDPKNINTFDVIAIELVGSVFQPIEITARDPAKGEREKLYSALFGNQTGN